MSLPSWKRSLCWVLVAGVLVGVGAGAYRLTPPPAPMCVIDGDAKLFCFADQGRRLVTRAEGWSMQVWDTRTGALVSSHLKHSETITFRGPSNGGLGHHDAAEYRVVDGQGQSAPVTRTMQFLNLQTGINRELSLTDHTTTSFYVSRADEFVARTYDFGEGSVLEIYETASGRVLHRRSGNTIMLNKFTDAALFYHVLTHDRQASVEVWSVRDRKIVATMKDTTWATDWSRDGDLCVIQCAVPGHTKGKCAVWNLKTLQVDGEFALACDNALQTISADKRWVALRCKNEHGWHLELRELPSGQPIGAKVHEDVQALEFSADGRFLALSLSKPATSLLMVEIPAMKVLWQEEKSYWTYISPDSRTIFTVAANGDVAGHDCETGMRRARIPMLGSPDRMTWVSQTQNGATLLAFHTHEPPIEEHWLARIPWLGRLITNRQRDTAVVFDTDVCRERFRLQNWDTTSALLSDDGRTLATSHDESDERTVIRVWDVDAWKPLHWALGVPAGLGTLIVLAAWWRARRSRLAAERRGDGGTK